jgi:hypothetical protein
VLGAVARDVSIEGFTTSCGKLSFSSATSRYLRAAASYARPASASEVKQPRCVWPATMEARAADGVEHR